MRRRLQDLLRHAGLKEDEIVLYLQLLKLRQSTIPELRAKTRLPNITVYRALLRLVERALVEAIPISKKQSVYRPIALSALIRKVAAKRRALGRLELELSGLDRFLPYLDPDAEEQTVELRSGREAFREEYLKFPELLHDEYLHIGNMANMWKASGYSYECAEERGFIHRRLKRNVYARVLDVPTPEAQAVQQRDSLEKRTLILKEALPIMDDFLLIGETQVSYFLCNPEDPRVIVMRDPAVVTAHRGYFDALWRY